MGLITWLGILNMEQGCGTFIATCIMIYNVHPAYIVRHSELSKPMIDVAKLQGFQMLPHWQWYYCQIYAFSQIWYPNERSRKVIYINVYRNFIITLTICTWCYQMSLFRKLFVGRCLMSYVIGLLPDNCACAEKIPRKYPPPPITYNRP